MARLTCGDDVKQRVKRLFEDLLAYANDKYDNGKAIDIQYKWQNEKQLVVRAKRRYLEELTAKDKYTGKLTAAQVREAIKSLNVFLGILDDHRTTTQGSEDWHFTLNLWEKDQEENLRQFEIEWDKKRPQKSQAYARKAKSQINTLSATSIPIQPTAYENLSRKGIQRQQFKGRDRELIHLHHLLQQNSQVAITAAVVGMGGVGKTELAIQYAREHLSTYQGGVCWLPANDFASKLVEFAHPHFFPNINLDNLSPLERVRYCWQHWAEGEVLLIVDNVTNYKQQVHPLPESHRFKVLITTREQLGKPIVRLDLEVLKPDQALDLLKFLLGNERVEQELDAAAELCKDLGYLPLGLELVGRYLADEPISIAQMMERLQRKGHRDPVLMEADPMMTAKLGVAAAFELSWERLDKNSQQLGCLLSLFALAPIPWELVEGVYKFWQGNEFDLEDLEKPRRNLIKLSLLNREHTTYSLHPLIRDYFKDKLEGIESADEIKQGMCRAMAKVATEIPQNSTLELIKEFSIVIPHMEEVATVIKEFIIDQDLPQPFLCLVSFYQSQGFYDQAKHWFDEFFSIAETRNVPAITMLNNQAIVYIHESNYTQAENLCMKALEKTERLRKDNISIDYRAAIPTTAIRTTLGRIYCEQKRYSQALSVSEQALEELNQVIVNLNKLLQSCSTVPSIVDPTSYNKLLERKATNLNTQGKVYCEQDNWDQDQAQLKLEEALQISQSLPPDINFALTMCILDSFAYFYLKCGNLPAAERTYKDALELVQKTLGEDHQNFGILLNSLAHLHILGYYSQTESEQLYLQALNILEKRLRTEHPETVKVRRSLEHCRSQMS
ncbi:MAG: tetratricopeptide repeat protein [Coleofasciculus sp. G1-WW12-02]|uniref:tetratricopeptide repeat protein n=1 Tax=Coleofasciculus sp. G1-WW12-02 TaxID=3068483 RepID=UPI0033028D3B